VGTQTVLALLEQHIATGGWRYWCGCGDWYGWRLQQLLDGNRHRWYDLGERRLLGCLGGEPRATARALFPVSLAFLLGAFVGRL
jgi:hypothetical protein